MNQDQSNKITLRAIEIEDYEKTVTWRNDNDVTSLLAGNTFFVSKYRESNWIKSAIEDDSKNLRIGICFNEELVGYCSLTNINWINRSAEFSIIIGNKDFWGKGIGKVATKLLLDHAFNEMNLFRIYLYVISTHETAIKLYKNAGFKEEGLLKSAVFKNGVYQDLILMANLNK